MWTPTIHDITVGPVNYTDNPNTLNNGTNITYTAPTLVTGGSWPAAALADHDRGRARAGVPRRPGDDARRRRPGARVHRDLGGAGFPRIRRLRGQRPLHGTNGDAVSLTFTGTGVSFIGEKSSDQGLVAWSHRRAGAGDGRHVAPSGAAARDPAGALRERAAAAGTHVLQSRRTAART